MRNYKMTIAYDGTKYQGWQRQSTTEQTIQGILEQELSRQIGYAVEIDGSGRTDGGVHALGQVANVKLSGKVEEEALQSALNANLPEDIRIREIRLVKNKFHSRYSARAKRYVYTVDFREKPCVFTRKYCGHYTGSLEIERMRQGAALLVGTHDFGGFTDKKDEMSTVRTIHEIEIRNTKHRGQLQIMFQGDGFMYHMVRILTGTLLEIGSGEKEPEVIREIFQSRKRSDAGFLAPASGLCLEEVFYEM